MKSLESIDRKTIDILNKHDLLKTLVERELMEKELNSIELSEDVEEKLFKDFMNNQKIESNNQETWLKKNNIVKKELVNTITKPIKVNLYCKKNFIHKAKSRFLKKKNSLDQVVYSLIRVKNCFEINELYLRVKEGEDSFGSISNIFSNGPEKNSNGIVGPVPLNQAHPRIVEKLSSMQKGEISKPFRVENWHLIVKLEYMKEAILNEEMELIMAKEMFQEWINNKAIDISQDLSSTKL